MDYLVGLVLAIIVAASASFIGFDRDRAFYPTIMIVIASYYALFAMIGGSMTALAIEAAVALAFLGLAVAGFKFSLWFVVIALAAHGVFDFFHHQFIDNPGVPSWWGPFCLGYDVAAAGYLAWLLQRRRGPRLMSR
ncbi:MAG TPA: hypothetical protein VLI06_17435 [Solimonas sp.]|nr:hypothetical protein [Solimonas sp.]